MEFTEREREIIYFILSREIDDIDYNQKEELYQKEFNELDTLRDRFK